MKNKLRLLALLIISLCCFSLFCACDNKENQKTSIICSTYAEYDWVSNILGEQKENYSLTLLTDNGKDLHSYQPSIADVTKISRADMFIYVGGESTSWVEKALKNKQNKNMIVVNLLNILGDNAQIEDVFEDQEDKDEIEYDEHVWLSLKNAKLFVTEITKSLKQLDSENASTYETNATNYIARIQALDNNYTNQIDNCRVKSLVFGDRFPFKYLATDYNLTYYAAFNGCSAETEASFSKITSLAQKVDELGLKAVVKIETSDGKIANQIIENTKNKNQKLLTLNSMQKTDTKSTQSYLAIMTTNLSTLCEALS